MSHFLVYRFGRHFRVREKWLLSNSFTMDSQKRVCAECARMIPTQNAPPPPPLCTRGVVGIPLFVDRPMFNVLSRLDLPSLSKRWRCTRREPCKRVYDILLYQVGWLALCVCGYFIHSSLYALLFYEYFILVLFRFRSILFSFRKK